MIAVSMAPPAPPAISCETTPPTLRWPVSAINEIADVRLTDIGRQIDLSQDGRGALYRGQHRRSGPRPDSHRRKGPVKAPFYDRLLRVAARSFRCSSKATEAATACSDF